MSGRVLHIVPSAGWGGVERVACTLHRVARERGWDSRIDAPALELLDRGIERETAERVAPRAGERDLRAWAFAARARVKAFRPDVVHAHLPYPDRVGAVAIAARGRPVVATFGLLPERGKAWPPDEVLRTRSDRTLAIASRAMRRSRWVSVSASDADALGRYVPARKLVHVPNAPPLAPAAPPPLPPVAWPEGAVRLLSVGRYHRQKGFDRMIAALAREPTRSLAWHWVVAGDGDEKRALESAAAAAGLGDRVTFLSGYPASALFPTADLVLSPSRWEGLPLVPMEAVEAGVPVLGSDIPPHRELFAATPESVLPADEAAWTARVASVIADPASRAAIAASQRGAVATDPRRIMWDAYEALYRAVIRV